MTLQSCGAFVVGGCGMMGDQAGKRRVRNARGDTFNTKDPWWGYNVQVGVGASSGAMYTRRLL
ncbi:MAG TPA: hypothetical protein VK975_02005 [Acidimicrobiales bacterium]|nr:hypothetical protein [Acidimicrobiales bacterium]